MKKSEQRFIKHFDEIMLDKEMNDDQKWNQVILARILSIQTKDEQVIDESIRPPFKFK